MLGKAAIVTLGEKPDLFAIARENARLEEQGWQVLEGPHLRRSFGHTARACQARRADLAWALGEPGITLVWIAPALAGSMRFLPVLARTLDRARTVVGGADAALLFDVLRRKGMRHLAVASSPAALAGVAPDRRALAVHPA